MMKTRRKLCPALSVTSDASGSWGCGAYAGSKWFMLQWVGPAAGYNITVKELIPIVIAAALWGREWQGKSVLVQCDNAAVVSIINHGSSKNPEAMHLMRCLVFIAAKWEFHLVATHIKGVNNTLADALSRDNLVLFHSLHPQADREPSIIPEALLEVLIISRPDWTSRSWTEMWSTIFGMA